MKGRAPYLKEPNAVFDVNCSAAAYFLLSPLLKSKSK